MKKRAFTIGVFMTALFITSQAFSAQFLFTPRSFVRETYTDNVFLTEKDTKDDFITEVSAGFQAELLGRTAGLTLAFDPGYVFYQDYTEKDTWRLPANLMGWYSPSRTTRWDFSDSFIRTEDPLSEDQIAAERSGVAEVGDTTIRRNRKPYYSNTARLNFSHQFGKEDQVYAGFLYGLLRNDDDQVEDNNRYAPSAGLDYWFTQWFGSQLFAEYTRGEYDRQSGFVGEGSSDFDNWWGTARLLGRTSPHFSIFVQYDQIYRNFTSGTDNDYVVYAPSAGISYDVSRDAYVRLGLGYYYQDIKDEKNQQNPFINGEVSKTWDYRRGLINLLGLAGLTQNDFGAQNIGFQQFASIQGLGRYDFTRKFYGDIRAYYRYSHTPGQTDQGGGGDENTSQIRAGAGLGFVPFRWMDIRLGYTFNYYNSNTDEDYNENRAMLTITLRPDQPWRF